MPSFGTTLDLPAQDTSTTLVRKFFSYICQFDDVGVRGTGFSSHGSKVKCAVKKPELERPGGGALLSRAYDDIIIVAEEEEHVFYPW